MRNSSYVGPCLCGDPECGRCFPAGPEYFEEEDANYQAAMQREYEEQEEAHRARSGEVE